MKKIHVWVQFPDEKYLAYEREARRQKVPVARLVEQTLDILLREEEQKIKDGTNHPLIIS